MTRIQKQSSPRFALQLVLMPVPFFSAHVCTEFMEIVLRNKAKYKEATQAKESKITKYHTQEVVDL